jgi:hypothetical protein
MDESQEDFWPYDKLPEPHPEIERGNFDAALKAFAMRELLDYRESGPSNSDVWVCGFGVTLWLMGDRYGAGRLWSHVCAEVMRGRIKYSSTGNFQAGLLLWFAAVWLKHDGYDAAAEEWHDAAAALFNKLLSRKWPVMGADFSIRLAKLLRQELDFEQVLAGIDEKSPGYQDYQWEALFYAGVRAFEEGNAGETRRLWAQATERTESWVTYEYYLLECERKKLSEKT